MSKGRTVPPPPQREQRAPLQTSIQRNRALPGLARAAVADTLEPGKTVPNTIKVAQNASELAALLVDVYARGEHVACRAGCAWCCMFTYISTSATEVIRIAEYLRERQSPEQIAALVKRLAQREERIGAMGEERRQRARIPCALLVDNRCSVYDVRPLACMGVTSSDATACESSYRSGWKRQIPNGARHLGITLDVRDGVSEGLDDAGLDGAELDLTIALRIALETPDAAERWLAGEPVFVAAEI